MKKIHKLILKAYLGPMIMTFFIVIFVLMMNFVWKYIDEFVGKGLDPWVIIELIIYATANMIPIGLPLAIMLATIMTMGNLGENYELLAMKSAGMSLLKIMEPLIIVVGLISIGSFFVVNDLVPSANRKMFSTLYDIRRQNQALEFQDGLFFNGIDNMSIRVEKQDPETKLLRGVLIYDNRSSSGNMSTTLADSGYIRLSDDKNYLLVTLYNGETYEQTRNSQWYTKSTLRHNRFDRQEGKIPMSGFNFERSDENIFSSNSQTKNIKELQSSIDSLDKLVSDITVTAYNPLMRDQIFSKDPDAVVPPDSVKIDRSHLHKAYVLDSIGHLDLRTREKIWTGARQAARNSQNMFTFDESTSKEALNQLYRSKNEWHRKLALPVSIMIFFLVGAPLGAIIRKGGLGTPIVISVIFFVIYYIISTSGEKLAKEGTWDSSLGMWISTIVLTPLAIYLTYKANNDSALLDVDWYAGRIKKLRDRLYSRLPERWQAAIMAKEEEHARRQAERRARKAAKKAAKKRDEKRDEES